MAFWKTQRSEKQTDDLVERMVQEWKISADDAREYVEGRGAYLRMKDLKKIDEVRQFQRAKQWGTTAVSIDQP